MLFIFIELFSIGFIVGVGEGVKVGVMDTDIGDKFVKAIDVRTKKPVGKDHPLKHRDGIEIIIS